jgi:enoyl-CoA hydratase
MGAPLLSIEGPVATITLDRPDQANRLEPDDLAVLKDHVAAVDAEADVRVLRLQSTGRYFCSGYDIGRIGGARTVHFEDMVNAFEDARPVTLALIQGGVYGGATDLALACDFRIGVPEADMFMAAARLGLHFYPRGLQRYLTRLGLDNAKRLFLTGERIDAAEMKAIGFLTHLAAADALNDKAEGLTRILVGMAPLALLGMKKNLNRMATGRLDEAEMLADIARCVASDDLREGRAAWAEKRPPRFSGR